MPRRETRTSVHTSRVSGWRMAAILGTGLGPGLANVS